ncbi:MAG: DUF1311 domain-containing protein [Acidobacteria bacterium]|nr:DUF1311 domain-containing protein [Acidobacteriota bacterium]
MKHVARVVSYLCLAAWLSPASASHAEGQRTRTGPSFDCAKASTATEKAICGADDLSQLDKALGQQYGKARSLASIAKRRMLVDEQRGWLERRNACGGTATCLRPLMQKRLDTLVAFINEFEHPREERVGPFLIRYERAPRWDVIAPVIVNSPPGASPKLRDAFAALMREGCDGQESDATMYHSSDSSVVFADDRFITVHTESDYFCGGAYPTTSTDVVTYLVTSGARLERKGAVTDVLNAEAILEIVKATDPKAEAPDPDCLDGLDNGLVAPPAVVKGGIRLAVTFPHVLRMCDVDVVVPASRLKPFLVESGPLFSLAK